MAKKFYVVWKGRETGIFTDWESCKRQVDKFNGAKYKSFKTEQEAQSAFNGESLMPSQKNNKASGASAVKKKTSARTVKTYTAGEIAAMLTETKIFTDGGCDPNPGESGSGIAVYRDNALEQLWYGLYNPQGTNNSAELNALHQALLMAEAELDKGRSAVVFCDSQYSIKCITQWAVNWEKNGWKKSGGEIKNLQLIQEMFVLYQKLKDKIQVLHVNGHVGVEGNELADRMSILAIESRERAFTLYSEELDIQAVLAMRAG
ncbi:ribonuclease H family protein [Psychromonas aquimarina]|uniref:ribonuclease H family protein n=1 Tax=Psychromonas aquimarina TaxID=444919 RepID=UPI00048F37F5|nr:ribonuclease H family protein [Psychromonas aquimarina]